ncbi:anti-sigma regulatory factor (Ser/Thr protein kinase) [Actinocorallia herbida]|uniref:Anti-sigma regulatory factor (Ser/Thr protein kinase) n=1 Tax=Actinocorallia herbida TaxID=58109 RepID=A0A3N1D1F1_9ACTN|nr:ATP-binding protein [Actinocorallia herbida]ROO87363.1 anti-sigma regulatory factor (Ser/Thr protein kinase) [Actinocorallia herbida]
MTGRRAETVLPGVPEAAAVARRWLAGFLGAAHPVVDTAVLLLSEVFANACLHSRSGEPGGTVVIRAEAAGCGVRVEVVDEGGWPGPLSVADPGSGAESGRGLWLLDALAKEWNAENLPDGGRRVAFTVEAGVVLRSGGSWPSSTGCAVPANPRGRRIR